ncbi:MAG: PEGA domain-containing protein [Myxococcales bacterium]|nr:PEGA domain-containing protein [Myxococcales bacterium]
MRVGIHLAFGAALLGNVAVGQEMGLDLTDATDYRPAAAILGFAAVDPELPPEQVGALKVDKAVAKAVSAAQKLGLYSAVLTPAQGIERLSDGYAESQRCADPGCFGPIAEKLDVNQVLLGQLVRREGRTVLRLHSFTRYTGTAETTELPAEKPRELERGASKAVEAALKKAGAVLGLLKVKGTAPEAKARLGPNPLGKLPVSKLVPPGSHTVTVEAGGHLPEELEVTVKMGETAELEASLVPAPPPAPVVAAAPPAAVVALEPAPAGKQLWERPGLYVAVAGAAAVALGASLGASAKATESRAKDVDGDGALDITRREASAAQRNAVAANALLWTGTAALLGGSVWVLVTPGPPPPKAPPSGPAEPELVGMIGIFGTLP